MNDRLKFDDKKLIIIGACQQITTSIQPMLALSADDVKAVQAILSFSTTAWQSAGGDKHDDHRASRLLHDFKMAARCAKLVLRAEAATLGYVRQALSGIEVAELSLGYEPRSLTRYAEAVAQQAISDEHAKFFEQHHAVDKILHA